MKTAMEPFLLSHLIFTATHSEMVSRPSLLYGRFSKSFDTFWATGVGLTLKETFPKTGVITMQHILSKTHKASKPGGSLSQALIERPKRKSSKRSMSRSQILWIWRHSYMRDVNNKDTVPWDLDFMMSFWRRHRFILLALWTSWKP